MKYGILFSMAAGLLANSAAIHRGWFFLLLWPSLSFAVIASGYFYFGPGVYGKSSGGIISRLNLILLLPYLLVLWSAWSAFRLIKREPAFNQLTEHVFVGRRLLSHELPDNIDHVIDLTCEFTEPKGLRTKSYHSFQVLDGFAPSAQQLCEWVEHTAQLSGNIYIHCAEGHGRTGLFAAAVLLQLGDCKTVDDALRFIKSKRPKVRLGRRQLAILRATKEVRELH